MSPATQLLSKPRGRAARGVESVADVRIRWRSFTRAAATLLALGGLVLAPAVIAKDRHGDGHWVGTWSASPQAVGAPIQLNGQTVRQIVHTSLGGEPARVRLSNAYGTSALVVGSAHVAVSTGGASISRRTDRTLRFNGSPTITIPAGALAVSDAVELEVEAFDNLAVSLYLPENVAATTQHSVGQQTNYISTPGDFTGAITFTETAGFASLNCTGMKHTASAGKNSSGRSTSTRSRKPVASGRQFAVSVDNVGYEASLERNKIYVVLPDRDAENDGDLCVVDESGEDYLFSADRVAPIDVPAAVKASVQKASRGHTGR